jgi:hypothetical protein
MADTTPAGTVAVSQEQAPPLIVNPPVTSIAAAPTPALVSGELNIDLTPLDENTPQADVLAQHTLNAVIARVDQYLKMYY